MWKKRPPSVARSVVLVVLSPITVVAAVVAYERWAPLWLIVTVWTALMGLLQCVWAAQRAEWYQPPVPMDSSDT
jgi:hypothetical protein